MIFDIKGGITDIGHLDDKEGGSRAGKGSMQMTPQGTDVSEA